jgi:hypothetical protein
VRKWWTSMGSTSERNWHHANLKSIHQLESRYQLRTRLSGTWSSAILKSRRTYGNSTFYWNFRNRTIGGAWRSHCSSIGMRILLRTLSHTWKRLKTTSTVIKELALSPPHNKEAWVQGPWVLWMWRESRTVRIEISGPQMWMRRRRKWPISPYDDFFSHGLWIFSFLDY